MRKGCNNLKRLEKLEEESGHQVGVVHQNVKPLGNSVDMVNNLQRNYPNCKILCITEHWKDYEELEVLGIDDF